MKKSILLMFVIFSTFLYAETNKIYQPNPAVENAVSNLRECIELNRKLGNKSNEIVFSRNLATVYIRSGSFKAALKQLDKIENELNINY